MERVRFCQRCAAPQMLYSVEQPNPCRHCGGTNFDLQPKLHVNGRGYELVTWFKNWRGICDDQAFLHTCGIDPEGY